MAAAADFFHENEANIPHTDFYQERVEMVRRYDGIENLDAIALFPYNRADIGQAQRRAELRDLIFVQEHRGWISSTFT
ncbi:hypothetical protein ACFLX7_05535 [Chloroflexota bacterium]